MKNKLLFLLVSPWLIWVLMVIGNFLKWDVYISQSAGKVLSVLAVLLSGMGVFYVKNNQNSLTRVYLGLGILSFLVSLVILYFVISFDQGLGF